MKLKFDFLQHNTLWIVVLWLLFAILVVSALPMFPDETRMAILFVEIAGVVCTGYIGLSGTTNIRKALQAPRGEYGYNFLPAGRRKEFWITIVFITLLIELMIFKFLLYLAVEDVLIKALFYAGLLSAAYVGINKGASVAAQSGPPAEAGPAEIQSGIAS